MKWKVNNHFKKLWKNWFFWSILLAGILVGFISWFLGNLLYTYIQFKFINPSFYLKTLKGFIKNYWYIYFIFAFVFYLSIFYWRLLKKERKYTTQTKLTTYGNAQFLVDMRNKFNLKEFNKFYKSDNNVVGFVVLMILIKKQFHFYKVSEKHVLVIGATGCGKTQKIIIPNIYHNAYSKDKPSMIIVDPKSEIYNITYNHLKQNNYLIYRIDLRDFHLSYLWNPLKIVWDYHNKYIETKDIRYLLLTEKYLNNIVDYIFNIKDNAKENTWTNGAKALFLGGSWFILQLQECMPNEIVTENDFNIWAIVNMITIKDPLFEKWVENLNGYLSQKNIDNFYFPYLQNTYFNSAEATAAGYFGNFSTILKLFMTQTVKFVLQKNEIDYQKILDEKTALFIVTPDEDITYHTLIGLFVNQFYTYAVDYATKQPNLTLKRQLQFLLDEFANIPTIPDFDVKIAVSRSRNIYFLCVVQSIAQLKTKYKNNYESLLNNFVTKIRLDTDEQDAQNLSKSFGTKTILETSYSKNNNPKHNSNMSEQIKGINLMNVGDILQIKNPYGFITTQKVHPALVKFNFAYENPDIYQHIDYQYEKTQVFKNGPNSFLNMDNFNKYEIFIFEEENRKVKEERENRYQKTFEKTYKKNHVRDNEKITNLKEKINKLNIQLRELQIIHEKTPEQKEKINNLRKNINAIDFVIYMMDCPFDRENFQGEI